MVRNTFFVGAEAAGACVL